MADPPTTTSSIPSSRKTEDTKPASLRCLTVGSRSPEMSANAALISSLFTNEKYASAVCISNLIPRDSAPCDCRWSSYYREVATMSSRFIVLILFFLGFLSGRSGLNSAAAEVIVPVEGQPLAANLNRLMQALEFLGAPLPPELTSGIASAGQNAADIQRLLDPQVLFVVTINPEARVKVERG